jgi:hypothetical protein
VLPYLAMSYLYKRSNRLWHYLIQRRLTARVWRPLVEWARRRHIRFRRRLEERTQQQPQPLQPLRPEVVVSAGV